MKLKTLFILGDIGYLNNNLNFMVNNIANSIKPNDALTLMGDNFYPEGVEGMNDSKWNTYDKIFKNIDNPIYSILGNHDYLQNPKAQIQNDKWIMNDFYYKKEYDNVDLYFLDTVQFNINTWVSKEKIESVHELDYQTLIGDQLEWINTEMSRNKNKKKIVFGHYPILSNGVYKKKIEPLYQYLIETFKRNNVKLYISGHEHNSQFITRKIDDYQINQAIIGSTSEVRYWEPNYCFSEENNDMFDNTDMYYGILTLYDDYILLKYFNMYNQIKHRYKIYL